MEISPPKRFVIGHTQHALEVDARAQICRKTRVPGTATHAQGATMLLQHLARVGIDRPQRRHPTAVKRDSEFGCSADLRGWSDAPVEPIRDFWRSRTHIAKSRRC